MAILEQLFAEIEEDHSFELCTDPSEIDEVEEACGFKLPDDLKAFHRRYKTVNLFEYEYGATYRLVPANEMHPTRIDIYGRNTDEWGPSTWLSVCDIQDGNFVAIDVDSEDSGEFNYIECFHETFARPGECLIIAKTFTELLDRALQGDGNRVYYHEKGFVGYGDAMPLTPANAAKRIDVPRASRKGWLMKFTYKGGCYSEFFGDEEYGGKDQSFEAVGRFIDEVKGEHDAA